MADAGAALECLCIPVRGPSRTEEGARGPRLLYLQRGQTLTAAQLVRVRPSELGRRLWRPSEQLDPHWCCSL